MVSRGTEDTRGGDTSKVGFEGWCEGGAYLSIGRVGLQGFVVPLGAGAIIGEVGDERVGPWDAPVVGLDPRRNAEDGAKRAPSGRHSAGEGDEARGQGGRRRGSNECRSGGDEGT